MKKFLSALAVCVSLSACGGGGSSAVTCALEYWNGTVGTCLPEGWTVLDRETLRQRGVPDDVIVAFQSDESFAGQFPSITVTRETLAGDVAPAEYSKASIASVGVLPGYEQVDIRAASIDGNEVSLHIFSAQPRPDEPRRRFYQVSTVHDTVGYTATALTPVSVDTALERDVQFILNRVTFVAPVEEK